MGLFSANIESVWANGVLVLVSLIVAIVLIKGIRKGIRSRRISALARKHVDEVSRDLLSRPEFIAWDYVWKEMKQVGRGNVHKLPTQVQIFFYAWTADVHVVAGGFSQLYEYEEEGYFLHVPEAFRVIGCVQRAGIVMDALSVFKEMGHSADAEKREQLLENMSEHIRERLETLDDRYYELSEEENVHLKLREYIHFHEDVFGKWEE